MKKVLMGFIAAIFLLGSTWAGAEDLPDVQYYGYKIVHHMGAEVKHIEQFGFNTFDHPPVGNWQSFVISPALDHFYSKAVADVRFGPVIVDTPPKDDRYSSIEIFDQEHYAIYDKLTPKEGERFVIVHEDYKGEIPKGTLIKVKCNFPFVFLRTQIFAFNEDKKADAIRRNARISGKTEALSLPDPSNTQAVIAWSLANSNPYPETKGIIVEAINTYTPQLHKETFENLKAFAASGAVQGNTGMFEPLGHPEGGSTKMRAAGTMLGHLGFPVHHAYYQNIALDRTGRPLAGANGPFVITLPFKSGVDLFWSLTRYDARTYLPLNPAEIGGNDIQVYNEFNTKPDSNGNVTITSSKEDPKDGTYWMPVLDSGYYFIARYYAPTSRLNGNTAMDIVYKGTELEEKLKAVKFK